MRDSAQPLLALLPSLDLARWRDSVERSLLAASLLMLVVGATGTAHAQSPVSEVKDSGGNTLMTVFDNGNLSLTGNLEVNQIGGFVGVNRSSPLTNAVNEVFGLRASTTGNAFGGMYVETTSGNGRPYYGYATDGSIGAYHFFDASTGKWHLNVSGTQDVTVQANGNVGINTMSPSSQLTVDGVIESTSGGITLPDGTVIDDSGDLGGVSLPFSGSASSNDPVFTVDNTGSGDAIRVNNAGDDGVEANGTEFGFFANGTNDDGMIVSNAGDDGIHVLSATNFAGNFDGDVDVSGDLTVGGNKNFKIDHPQDPTGKYLKHSTVESPRRLNAYTGNVTLNANGEATVTLPDYFESLNRDFRYQLTAIGAAAPRLHVAEEISNNQFRIAGGQSGMKVSWRVTGIRNDAWARQNEFEAEVAKPPAKRGTYRHPEAHGVSKSRGEAAQEKREKQ